MDAGLPLWCLQSRDVKFRPVKIQARHPGWAQDSGPAARLRSKFRPGLAFCETRAAGVGLMLVSGEVIVMCYALAAGLRAVPTKDAGWPAGWLTR